MLIQRSWVEPRWGAKDLHKAAQDPAHLFRLGEQSLALESGSKRESSGSTPWSWLDVRRPSPDLWVDTALCAMVTHNDTASLSACIAFVQILWDLLGMQSAPEPDWWVERYVAVARELETDTSYRPRGGAYANYSGPLSRFVKERLTEAWGKRLSVREACDGWYSGAYLLETVPSVLYILMCHGQNLEESIVRAVNDTKDNDTIAAIVGAAVGALHGKKAIPTRWIQRLSRTNDGSRRREGL